MAPSREAPGDLELVSVGSNLHEVGPVLLPEGSSIMIPLAVSDKTCMKSGPPLYRRSLQTWSKNSMGTMF
eukprot:265606-Pyramimonas_sp.AAC.1